MINETFASVDGLNIHFRVWRPEGTRPRALVVISHGFNSHGGYYGWAAERLVAAGFAVYALDHRGRGKSDGERFYIDKVSEHVDDLADFVKLAKSREPGVAAYLLGHSAGGVISCLYVLDHQSEIAGFICESFAFEIYAPDFAVAVLKGISHVAPHAHVIKLPNQFFSRDPLAVAAMNEDPLILHEVQPTRTVAEFARADERLKREFGRITLPLLIMHGTDDRVTKPHGSQVFFDTTGSTDKTLKLYEGHYHDLLNDVGREKVLADIQSWIEARVPK